MQTKENTGFDEWFTAIQDQVYMETSVEFSDAESVRDDYEAGKTADEVANDIIDEYNCD